MPRKRSRRTISPDIEDETYASKNDYDETVAISNPDDTGFSDNSESLF